MARPRGSAAATEKAEFACPECGKEFTRAAALGAHRKRAHGVAGASARAQAKERTRAKRRSGSAGAARTGRTGRAVTQPRGRSRATTDGANGRIDRDALLQALFPNGVPAREDVIRRASAWLDEAETLATAK